MQERADGVYLLLTCSGEPTVVDLTEERGKFRQPLAGLVGQCQRNSAAVFRIPGFIDPASRLKLADDRRYLSAGYP